MKSNWKNRNVAIPASTAGQPGRDRWQHRIEYVPISALKPWKRNARTHSKKQIGQIAGSIAQFGFTNPVLVDAENQILAGHGRVAAAKQLQYETVPCIRLEHMTKEEKQAYVLADNKLALNAGWDQDILAQELKELYAADLDFDVGVIGFSIAEIDNIIESATPEEPDNPDDNVLPALHPSQTRCHPGDIWQMGAHRLICGDSCDPYVIQALMQDDLARMVITDPPYNVKIDGNVGGLGKIKHREFAMASGEMTEAEFTKFLGRACRNLADFSIEGSIHFIFMDWRHQRELLAATSDIYSEQKNLIVWVKDNGGMGTFYRSRHELVYVFKKGDGPHVNTFELGQHGRYRTNVWEYKGANTRKSGRLDELAMHPTVKPVQMLADAIKDVSARGDIVLDIFGGSGSTLIAADKTGRKAYICEIDPVYCDRMLRRWEAFAHDEAELVACGYPRQDGGRSDD